MDDKEFDRCMERIRNSDQDALQEIYKSYAGYLFHYLLGILQNRENAEDVTSELFIRIWKKADQYIPGNGHKSWLTTIARNMAIDYMRAHKREIPYDHTEPVFEREAKEKVEDVLGDIQMQRALEELKPEEREIVHLKIIGDMTLDGISKALGLPMTTVAWRYRQAIKKLRRCGYEA